MPLALSMDHTDGTNCMRDVIVKATVLAEYILTKYSAKTKPVCRGANNGNGSTGPVLIFTNVHENSGTEPPSASRLEF
jgi:hypothetical protein